MANDFSGDSACVALYNFESGALTTDSKGTNTLTDQNTVAENTTDYKQGACSADFEHSSDELFYINDTDLDSGFPFKSGESNKDITVCFWIHLESFDSDWYPFYKGKVGEGNLSISLGIESTENNRVLKVRVGWNGGASGETYEFTAMDDLVTSTWYHVGFTYTDSTKTAHVRVWDDTAGSNHYDGSHAFSNAAVVDNGQVCIGGISEDLTGRMDGEIDEYVVFNDVKSSADIDLIRAGTYGAASSDVIKQPIIGRGIGRGMRF
jgi:hypothetical protein